MKKSTRRRNNDKTNEYLTVEFLVTAVSELQVLFHGGKEKTHKNDKKSFT